MPHHLEGDPSPTTLENDETFDAMMPYLEEERDLAAKNGSLTALDNLIHFVKQLLLRRGPDARLTDFKESCEREIGNIVERNT